MVTDNRFGEKPWHSFHGPNLGYINTLFERYKRDPNSIDKEVKELFEQWGAPPVSTLAVAERNMKAASRQAAPIQADPINIKKL